MAKEGAVLVVVVEELGGAGEGAKGGV